MRPTVAANTHFEVPDYLDPRRKIKVPRQELREPLDDQFYALHLGGSPSPVPSLLYNNGPYPCFKKVTSNPLQARYRCSRLENANASFIS